MSSRIALLASGIGIIVAASLWWYLSRRREEMCATWVDLPGWEEPAVQCMANSVADQHLGIVAIAAGAMLIAMGMVAAAVDSRKIH